MHKVSKAVLPENELILLRMSLRLAANGVGDDDRGFLVLSEPDYHQEPLKSVSCGDTHWNRSSMYSR